MKKIAFIGLLLIVSTLHIYIFKQTTDLPKTQAKKREKIIKIKLSQVAIQQEKPKIIKRSLPPVVLPKRIETKNEISPPLKPIAKSHKPKTLPKKKRVHRRKKTVKKRAIKKLIKKIDRRSFQKSTQPPPSIQTQTINNSALKRSYIAKIRELIKSNLYYPKVARRMRIQGVVKVSFVIRKDGTIDSIKIGGSSKKILNKGALRTLQNIKAPPIPDDLGVMSLDLFVPIEFKLGG